MTVMDTQEILEEIESDTNKKVEALNGLINTDFMEDQFDRLTAKRDALLAAVESVFPLVAEGRSPEALRVLNERASGKSGGELEGVRLAHDVIAPLVRLHR